MQAANPTHVDSAGQPIVKGATYVRRVRTFSGTLRETVTVVAIFPANVVVRRPSGQEVAETNSAALTPQA